MKILALDPGGTTGWAMMEDSEEPLGLEHEQTWPGVSMVVRHNRAWTRGQLGPEPHHSDLYALLELAHTEHDFTVVCESFQYRNQSRPGLVLDSVEYIGITKLFAADRNVKLTMQTASVAKTFVSDDKIKKLDLWYPGWRHSMDATRHLLYHLVTKRQDDSRDILQAWKPKN